MFCPCNPSMTNIEEGKPFQEVAEAGLSGLLVPSDPICIKDEEVKGKEHISPSYFHEEENNL